MPRAIAVGGVIILQKEESMAKGKPGSGARVQQVGRSKVEVSGEKFMQSVLSLADWPLPEPQRKAVERMSKRAELLF